MLNKKNAMATFVAAVIMGMGAQALASDLVHEDQIHDGAANAELSREQVVDVILGTWESHLDGEGMERMETLLSSADSTNLRSAMDMLDYEEMIAALAGAPVEKGDDGWNILALGDLDRDLVYTPITPCRIVDTRVASPRGGVIPHNSFRGFYSWVGNFATSQGGHASNCGIPPSPAGLAINVTAVNPDRDGFVTVYPADSTRPNASSLNYAQGEIAGNEVIGVMRQGVGLGFEIYAWGAVHVVVDAVGYFMAPVASPMDCQTEVEDYTVSANAQGTATAVCPAGYSGTGGGCAGVTQGIVRSSQPSLAGNGWFCRTQNESASSVTHRAHARCCRIPGR